MPTSKIAHRRQDVLERATRAFEALDDLIVRLRPEDWERPVPRPEGKDAWTVKDALAHVVHWKAHTVRVFRRQRRPPDERGLTISELNHLVYERWRQRPFAEVVAWHRQVHRDVLAALAEVPEEVFSGRAHSPVWPEDFDGHSEHHRVRDIEAALAT